MFQIKHFILFTEYYDADGEEELPLGPEFQEHLECFISPSNEPGKKYTRARKLVQQLEWVG